MFQGEMMHEGLLKKFELFAMSDMKARAIVEKLYPKCRILWLKPV